MEDFKAILKKYPNKKTENWMDIQIFLYKEDNPSEAFMENRSSMSKTKQPRMGFLIPPATHQLRGQQSNSLLA